MPVTRYHRWTRRKMQRLRTFWGHWSLRFQTGIPPSVLQSLCPLRRHGQVEGSTWQHTSQPTRQRTGHYPGQPLSDGAENNCQLNEKQIACKFKDPETKAEKPNVHELCQKHPPLFYGHPANHPGWNCSENCVKLIQHVNDSFQVIYTAFCLQIYNFQSASRYRADMLNKFSENCQFDIFLHLQLPIVDSGWLSELAFNILWAWH